MPHASYADLLPKGVRSRFIDNNNGLAMHVLEAGFETPGRPALLLVHGFPELAFCWRHVLPHLAARGFHVIAPDQRGYGLTTGSDDRFDGDLSQFLITNLVLDAIGLVRALGFERVEAVIGHDFGSLVAGWAALIRPDVFPAVAMMSAPFGGPPEMPLGTNGHVEGAGAVSDIHRDLAALPRPRKHYQWYYSTAVANADMWRCPQGVHDFLRAYYHHKSADWPGNAPFPLDGWTAAALAQMPSYYIMDLDKTMAETAAEEMPDQGTIEACRWLGEPELSVLSGEFGRTGFQGGLNWYRCMTSPTALDRLRLFAGRRIEVPSTYLAGRQDWGIYQKPGALEAMEHTVCSDFRGQHLINGAGHWVQQEQPDAVNARLSAFLAGL